MIKFDHRCVSKIAIAVVISGVSLAHVAYADTPIDPTAQKSSDVMKHEDGMKRIDERIKTLHDKLNVTADQEPQWKKVTQVMRQNETTIHKLTEARHENESAGAIDDLKSYEGIARAHEQGLKRLIPVFETFYNSLTPQQKTSADDMFGKYEGRKEGKAEEASPAKDNGSDTVMDKTTAPADANTAPPPPPPAPPPAPAPDDSK